MRFTHLPRYNVEVEREGFATDLETTGHLRYADAILIEFIHRKHPSGVKVSSGWFATGSESYEANGETFESFGEMTERFRPARSKHEKT